VPLREDHHRNLQLPHLFPHSLGLPQHLPRDEHQENAATQEGTPASMQTKFIWVYIVVSMIAREALDLYFCIAPNIS
jgi:hypothetical protein